MELGKAWLILREVLNVSLLHGGNVERYKNLGGDSGVVAFEINPGSITVQFNTGATYLYNTQSAGVANIEQMQNFANRGQGLNSYISRVTRKMYARKLN